MSTTVLSQLTLREKFQLMESIWEELRSHVEQIEMPQSHRDILDERRGRVERGEAVILEWDDVKHKIGKR